MLDRILKWPPWIPTHHNHSLHNHFPIRVGGICDLLLANRICSLEIKRRLLLRRKAMTNLDSVFESRDVTLLTTVRIVKAMVFPVVMYGCEIWTIKKAEHQRIHAFKLWCWRRLLRVPLDHKEIKPVNPKENQPWMLTGRTDAEAPKIWPPDAKNWLIRKDPDAGKDWGQEKKVMTEDEMMIGWHHWLNGHEFEQTLGDSRGQRNLACCSPWGCRVRRDLATEQQNMAKKKKFCRYN